MFHYLDLLGVIVFAVSGALEARERGMDVFGACAIGFVTALGGGTLRDMVLQHGPVFWVRDSTYIVLVTLASVATFLTAQRHTVPRRILLIADAGGLAVATTIGVQKALAASVSPVIALLMGVVTGVVGGIGRDVLCNEVPLVLCEDIYATVCLVGAILFLALRATHVPTDLASPIAVAFMFALRVAAIALNLRLPAVLRGPWRRQEWPDHGSNETP
ncbi:MAG: trimeric intracellular cation channel family protein [Capsulimonadaceae bacterium]|nr:trimeric intracellular cation channel family protein [Capsulimonadaceae bacterium]